MKTIIKVLINSFFMTIITIIVCSSIGACLALGACCFNPDVINFVLDPKGTINDFMTVYCTSSFIIVATFLMGVFPAFHVLVKFLYKRFKKNVDLIKEDEENEKQ